MLNVKRTAVTEHNLFDFYRTVYPMQMDDAAGLIDITNEPGPIIAIDCCGWHYQNIYKKNIVMLETIKSAHQFKLDRNKFTKLIDNRSDACITWPKIDDPKATILMDRSPLLRYKTILQLNHLLSDIAKAYNPIKILLRGNLLFVDDYRLGDRFYSWQHFGVEGFVMLKFLYDTEKTIFQIDLRARR